MRVLHIADCINETCPWSGDPVQSDSLTKYNGYVVGFCNPGCRDTFDSAVRYFDEAKRGAGRTPDIADAINEICPWSGKPVQSDSLTEYDGNVVGFCNPGCRDKFDSAVRHFQESKESQTSR